MLRTQTHIRLAVTKPTVVLLAVLCVWLSLGVSVKAQAEKRVITIATLSSSSSPVYQQVVRTFQNELPKKNSAIEYRFSQYNVKEIQKSKSNNHLWQHADMIVTVGSLAAKYAANNIFNTPIICGYLTRNSFQSIVSDGQKSEHISAVFIDQPDERLIGLASLLQVSKPPYKIALLGDAESSNLPMYERTGGDVIVTAGELAVDDNPVKKIEALMKSNDVFIVKPSARHFNRLAAKLVLQLSMKYKVAVIGFSKKYANAGALLSLYATPVDAGGDLASTTIDFINTGLSDRKSGKHFSITVNNKIAGRQGLSLDADNLQSALERQEGERLE
jgi:ABC-type uncharacterized transport system substrate-binding protein